MTRRVRKTTCKIIFKIIFKWDIMRPVTENETRRDTKKTKNNIQISQNDTRMSKINIVLNEHVGGIDVRNAFIPNVT